MSLEKPLIFDIAKGSIVDGPGIRTVVFFKGCPLNCLWCQNPESQSPDIEIFYFPEECIKCGNCKQGKRCYTGARQVTGEYYSPSELIATIMKDKTYYEVSGGGVTFSGGEPFLYYEYLEQVLPELKREQIGIAVQTSGFFDLQVFKSGILEYIETIYCDLKVLDTEKHREFTGVSNEIIIENFLKLLQEDIRLVPRVPLIPGFTATENNLRQISGFLRRHRVTRCELLPYNTAGLDKWKRLGRDTPAGIPNAPMSKEEEDYWHRIFIDS